MSDRKKDAAQVQFAKLQKEQDGRKAMSEYESESVRVRSNMERLRALRIAREAETAKTVAAAPAAKPRAKAGAGKAGAGKTTKASKSAPGKLGDWLDGQKASGRRS